MRIRESGMPEEKIWDSFFDVQSIFNALEIDNRITNLVEIGCGYGTFTIPASKAIKGLVYAFDIDKAMVSVVQAKIESEAINNISIDVRDILHETTGLPDNSIDYVMLFNLLHLENPKDLLIEAYRILKKDGRLGVIHWRQDIETPRGPSLDIRPKPESISCWLNETGFSIIVPPVIIEPYHFGLLGIK